MTRRRDLVRRIDSYTEINGIMVAMKNLAYVETRRLASFLDMQQQAVNMIETAAADFLAFYGDRLSHAQPAAQMHLLIGSERGFCGDFNDAVLAQVRPGQGPLIAVGSRLLARMQDDTGVAARIEGPSVAEEVQPVLVRLVQLLCDLQQRHRGEPLQGLTAYYHGGENGEVICRRLLPMPEPRQSRPQHAFPPLLNLSPLDFFSQLTDHYLYAVLHEVFYQSLMAENRQRLEHMDNALRKLDKDMARLRQQNNRLRQEEIIEEIEVILLSAEALDGERRRPRSPAAA
jgi:F-type H+-transporting ATPase subunit gamma